MIFSQNTAGSGDELLQGGPFSWRHLALWIVASVPLGGLTAWVAVEAQRIFAPWLLFSLLVGVGLGAMLVALMRVSETAHRPTLLLGAVLAAAVAVVGQHYIYYREAQRLPPERAGALANAAQAFPELRARIGAPPDFAGYMRSQAARGRALSFGYVARGKWAWLSWTVEGLLVVAATLAMVIPAMRLPYCRHCGSWYRTVRGGRLPPAAVAPLAALSGATLSDGTRRVRYRVANCRGGCGPTRFLLSWEEPDGRTFMAVTWFDAARCREALEIVDRG